MSDEEVLFDLARDRPGVWMSGWVSTDGCGLLRIRPHADGIDCSVSIDGGNWLESLTPLRSDLAAGWLKHHSGMDPWQMPWGLATDTGERYVYVVKAEGVDRWKIGRTKNLRHRMAALDTACPFPTHLIWSAVEVDGRTEASLHDRFADLRKHGEWFDLSGLLSACTIDDLLAGVHA